MVRKGQLTETESDFRLAEKADWFKGLTKDDQKHLLEIKKLYGAMNSTALMKHTYIHYPFFAINSIKASSILTKEELKKVDSQRPVNGNTLLFTIGYEGISLEAYLTRLLKNDVKLLVDVRNNPQSMKYGFSKTQLAKYCESLGIGYMHFPEVGIQSEHRKELNAQTDYDKLFETYKIGNLAKTKTTQLTILNLLKKYQRIALTCFEADICQCHRKPLAEAIESLPGFEYETKHI